MKNARPSVLITTIVVAATIVVAGSIACAPPIAIDVMRTSSEHAIRGGARDGADATVVGVVRTLQNAVDVCTGSLIAPNVVLTAHHCVADAVDAPNGTVSCGDSKFAAPASPDTLFVTTSTDLPHNSSGYHGV